MAKDEVSDAVRAGHGAPLRSRAARVLLAVFVLAAAAAAFTVGVSASFTDAQSGGPEPITTGIVHIVLATPAGDHGSLTTGALSNMAEGDHVYRVMELTNDTTVGASGTTGLASLTIGTTVTGTNTGADIVTDHTNGLKVNVFGCATAPTESGGTTGPWSYTCSGGFTTVVNDYSVAALTTTPDNVTAFAPTQGSSTYWVVDLHLPTAYADANSYNGGACSTGGTAGVSEQLENCSLSVTYNLVATQRAGASQ